MATNSVALGADHAGYETKELVAKFLNDPEISIRVNDVGTYSTDSVDYPDFAHQVATLVSEGKAELGILICGSGNGVCITANKHHGIRAALCWTRELAALARQHNNANVLCIPARFVSNETSLEMVEAFLNTDFEGGRHAKRADKIEL